MTSLLYLLVSLFLYANPYIILFSNKENKNNLNKTNFYLNYKRKDLKEAEFLLIFQKIHNIQNSTD